MQCLSKILLLMTEEHSLVSSTYDLAARQNLSDLNKSRRVLLNSSSGSGVQMCLSHVRALISIPMCGISRRESHNRGDLGTVKTSLKQSPPPPPFPHPTNTHMPHGGVPPFQRNRQASQSANTESEGHPVNAQLKLLL